MTRIIEDTKAPAADLIALGTFTVETKGPATQNISDGVQGQYRLQPGLSAE